jgi:hypothetical protein
LSDQQAEAKKITRRITKDAKNTKEHEEDFFARHPGVSRDPATLRLAQSKDTGFRLDQLRCREPPE